MSKFQRRIHIQHLTQLLIALISLITIPQTSSAQVSWQQITDREAGFTISFPGKPTYEQSSDPTLVHQTEKYKFFDNDRLFQIIFAPLSRPLRSSTELSDAFSEIKQAQAKDGVLLRQLKLPDGGRQYDNVTKNENRTAYHRTRVYIRNGRYYAISYSIHATDGLDEREAARFFSSFRFLDNVPAVRTGARREISKKAASNNNRRRGWYTFRAPAGDFIVDFPGKPDYREFPNPDTGNSDYKYYFHFGENTFIVSYREAPSAATQPNEVMRRALKKVLENNNVWRVAQHIPLRDGGHYIESQGMVDGVPVLMCTKLYLRGTRLYYVTTMTQNLTGPNKDDVVRFLSSFRLL